MPKKNKTMFVVTIDNWGDKTTRLFSTSKSLSSFLKKIKAKRDFDRPHDDFISDVVDNFQTKEEYITVQEIAIDG